MTVGNSSRVVICPICKPSKHSRCEEFETSSDTRKFACDTCGSFKISGSVLPKGVPDFRAKLDTQARNYLSYRARQNSDSGSNALLVTTELLDDLVAGRFSNPSVPEKIHRLIRLIGDHFNQTEFRLPVGTKTRSKLQVFSQSGVSEIVNSARSQGLVEVPPEFGKVETYPCGLTGAGWELYEALISRKVREKRGFLALQFGQPDLDEFFADHVKPLAKEELGEAPIDLRDVSRAGIIDNIMREEISASAYVVSDLTHDNPGAYWEAGFAEGIGIPVIYVCERTKFEAFKTHFDTNHCTTVMWSTASFEEDAKQLLATIKRSLQEPTFQKASI